jgi:hypothetical protein
VVTNFHVIDGALHVRVHLGDRDYPAEVRGTDPATDLALLQIHTGTDLPYFELADSDAARVGDWVMVIGNPLNLDQTVTTGLISAKGRSIGISDVSFENFIQTDAAINFGNSGGPVIDTRVASWASRRRSTTAPRTSASPCPPTRCARSCRSCATAAGCRAARSAPSCANLSYADAQAFGAAETGGVLVGSVTKERPRTGPGSSTATSCSRSMVASSPPRAI